MEHAASLYFQGQYEQAAAVYRGILDAQPQNVDALYQLAATQLARGLEFEALEYIDQAIALVPDEPRLHAMRGYILDDFERYGQALAAYERAIELDPADAHTHNNRGVLLEALGREEEAAEAFARALEIDPELPTAVFHTAMNLVKLDRDEEALALSGAGPSDSVLPGSKLIETSYQDYENGTASVATFFLAPPTAVTAQVQQQRLAAEYANWSQCNGDWPYPTYNSNTFINDMLLAAGYSQTQVNSVISYLQSTSGLTAYGNNDSGTIEHCFE